MALKEEVVCMGVICQQGSPLAGRALTFIPNTVTSPGLCDKTWFLKIADKLVSFWYDLIFFQGFCECKHYKTMSDGRWHWRLELFAKKKSHLVSLGFAGRVPINEDGIGFHFHRIGKAQGTTHKSYSPSEAWKESCVTCIWHRVPQWDIWWIAYEITFMKLNLILEQKYRQHTFQLIFL